MKTDYIIKVAEKRGYKLTRSMNTKVILAKKDNYYECFLSYNEFYRERIKGKK